jgi:hypothetical protein
MSKNEPNLLHQPEPKLLNEPEPILWVWANSESGIEMRWDLQMSHAVEWSMSLSREFNFERQTDRVHSISINPPLLPLNLSIDSPSLQQQGGCGGGGAPPTTERPSTWVIAERSLLANTQRRWATHWKNDRDHGTTSHLKQTENLSRSWSNLKLESKKRANGPRQPWLPPVADSRSLLFSF